MRYELATLEGWCRANGLADAWQRHVASPERPDAADDLVRIGAKERREGESRIVTASPTDLLAFFTFVPRYPPASSLCRHARRIPTLENAMRHVAVRAIRHGLLLAIAATQSAVAITAIAQETPAPVRVEEPPRRGTVRIAGTAVATDGEQRQHAGEDGELRLWHKEDGRIDVPIRDGKWETWVSSAAPVGINSVTLKERSIAIERLVVQPPYPESIALSGRWIEDFLLDVVDAESGEALDGIELVVMPPIDGDACHPGIRSAGDVPSAGQRSPLRLTRYDGWFIRATGHAWQKFHYIGHEEQESRLELPAACRLSIVANGLNPAGAAQVRIEPSNGGAAWLTLAPVADGRYEIDSLPPGRVHVMAFLDFHMQPWFWHTVALGSATVPLAPTVPARAEFTVGPPPPGLHDDGTVDRTGFVTLPDGTERERFVGDGAIEYQHVRRYERDESATGSEGWDTLSEQTPDGYDINRIYRADIRGGQVALRVPYGCWLAIESLELAGQKYELDWEGLYHDTATEPFEIAVPGASAGFPTLPLEIHVVDAESKAQLSHVSVVSGGELQTDGFAHPGAITADRILVKEGASPVAVPFPVGGDGTHVCWIGADGYAWVRCELSSADSGGRVVPLDRAASLRIEVVGDPPAGSVVRIYEAPDLQRLAAECEAAIDAMDEADLPEGVATKAEFWELVRAQTSEVSAGHEGDALETVGRRIAELSIDPAEPQLIEGLPRKPLIVSCELGEWFRQPQPFVRVAVDATAGGEETVRLEVGQQVIPDRVPVAGTVYVPPEWGEVDLDVSLRPERVPFLQDDRWIGVSGPNLRPVKETPGLYSFDAGDQLPGEYILAIPDFGFERRIEVGPEGAPDLRIEIAPPGDVVVHLVDDATGMPVVIDVLRWWSVTEAGGSMRAHAVVSASDPLSTWSFRATQGAVALHVWHEPYQILEEHVTVVAGHNEFTLRLRRDCGCNMKLSSGGRSIGWDEDSFDVQVTTLDGKPFSACRFGGGQYTVILDEPGRYRLVFRRFPGFKPVDSIEVDVRAGDFTDVNIELVPDREP
ncbi:MAG: carboxypeptidase regulatory-like domain-containing protein [Planctomycetes bacterium]|nr:carboxypeptidase regulatory-like domain-containing protein [Planctomycetota bacterium]